MVEQPLKHIIVVMGDTGMRRARSLYCMRIENMDLHARIGTPIEISQALTRCRGSSHRVRYPR